MSPTEEIALMLSLFLAGGAAGLFSRFLPLSGWTALAIALVVPPAGVGLAMAFC